MSGQPPSAESQRDAGKLRKVRTAEEKIAGLVLWSYCQCAVEIRRDYGVWGRWVTRPWPASGLRGPSYNKVTGLRRTPRFHPLVHFDAPWREFDGFYHQTQIDNARDVPINR